MLRASLTGHLRLLGAVCRWMEAGDVRVGFGWENAGEGRVWLVRALGRRNGGEASAVIRVFNFVSRPVTAREVLKCFSGVEADVKVVAAPCFTPRAWGQLKRRGFKLVRVMVDGLSVAYKPWRMPRLFDRLWERAMDRFSFFRLHPPRIVYGLEGLMLVAREIAWAAAFWLLRAALLASVGWRWEEYLRLVRMPPRLRRVGEVYRCGPGPPRLE